MNHFYKNNKSLLTVVMVSALGITACSEKKTEEEIKQPQPVAVVPPPPPTPPPPPPKVVPLAWLDYVDVPVGEFMMGCDSKTDKCQDDELPLRNVQVSEGFSVSKYEITQKAWQEIMGSNPSTFVGTERPVDSVSFNDVQQFIDKLNEIAGEIDYRLPSEAEWEYLARAGQSARFPLATEAQTLAQSAWFGQLETTGTQDVGKLQPNAWGIHDLSGNVMEWVQDCWRDNYENALPNAAAHQSETCKGHALRGGSWIDSKDYVRLAYRNHWDRNYRSHEVGFRLVKKWVAPPEPAVVAESEGTL